MGHVKGTTHTLADRLSLHPVSSRHCPDLEDHFVPHVTSKLLRTKALGDTPQDPHVAKIAEIGMEDKDYQYMIGCIKEKVPITSVKEGSELKKIQGQFNHLSLFEAEKGKVIVRDASVLLMPKEYRKHLLDELHSTHLSDISMMNLAKGHFYWP